MLPVALETIPWTDFQRDAIREVCPPIQICSPTGRADGDAVLVDPPVKLKRSSKTTGITGLHPIYWQC